jgi:predicted kinase
VSLDLVVLTGPIAAGKSAVGTGVARRVGGAVIDLDRVYEVLAGDPKADEAVWSLARRLAGAMASALFDEGLEAVVIEGEVWTPAHRAERDLSRDPTFLREQLDAFERELPWLREASEVLDTDALGEAELVVRVARGLRPAS